MLVRLSCSFLGVKSVLWPAQTLKADERIRLKDGVLKTVSKFARSSAAVGKETTESLNPKVNFKVHSGHLKSTVSTPKSKSLL